MKISNRYLIGQKYKQSQIPIYIPKLKGLAHNVHRFETSHLSDVLEIFVVIPPLIYDCSAALFFLRHKNVAMCHIGSSIVAPSSSQ